MVASRDLPERTNPLLEPTESTASTYTSRHVTSRPVASRRVASHRILCAHLLTPTPVDILIERRRLGQTNLAVKAGAAGIANATKADNLGVFDYAHLRVPLPKDLSGSGIFTLGRNTAYPESYFLMVRDQTPLRRVATLTRWTAPQQRWLRQRDRNVQGRLPLGAATKRRSLLLAPKRLPAAFGSRLKRVSLTFPRTAVLHRRAPLTTRSALARRRVPDAPLG
jgi:hypothetical protein